MFCKKCGTGVEEGVNFCASCGEQKGDILKPASMGKRFVNLFLDAIIRTILYTVLLMAFGQKSFWNVVLALLVAYFGYYIVFEYFWQRTPAKWVTGTKIVRNDGSKPKFWRVVGRTLARYIPFEALSVLFGKNAVGWHDKLSKTFVVPANYTADDVRKIQA